MIPRPFDSEAKISADALLAEGNRNYDQKNYQKALECYNRAAGIGSADAIYMLAECFANGQGVDTNHKQAMELYHQAAIAGSRFALYRLGLYYMQGFLDVPPNPEKAVEYYKKAAEYGLPRAKLKLAECLQDGIGVKKDEKAAFELMREAAIANVPEAQYIFGTMLENGPREVRDVRLAAKAYFEAAANGWTPAYIKAAKLIESGFLEGKDKQTAIELYKCAAAAGDLEANYKLGLLYALGEDVPKDPVLSEKHFLFAAERGHPAAISMIKDADRSILLRKMEINTELLAMRYKDTLPLLQEKEQKDGDFVGLLKASLLGYGSTHSSQGTGLFVDAYHREAMDENPGPDTDVGAQRKSKLFDKAKRRGGKEFALSSNPSTLGIFKPLMPADVSLTEDIIAGRRYQLLSGWEKRPLAHMGQLATRDSQLWIAAHNEDFQKLFAKLFHEMNPTAPLSETIETMTYRPSTDSAAVLQKRILEKLKANQREEPSGQQFFYLKLLSDLIKNLSLESKDDSVRNEQIRLALSRLEYIFNKAIEKRKQNYEDYLIYLEYAFDEVMLINTMNQTYKPEEIRKIFTDFITAQYDAKETPPQILLSGSGMAMITNLSAIAFEEIRECKGFQEGGIYIHGQAYYEIPMVLGYQLKHLVSAKEVYATFGSKDSTVGDYKGTELSDIMICGFKENLSITGTSPQESVAKDVVALIEQQLKLRAEQNSDKRLIVIIDTTLNAFDDCHMNHLLMRFGDQIKSGQLAVMTAHSLNKHFHTGFDKMPSALGAAFYNPEFYPKLDDFCSQHWLGGFFENDPTPQMLAHFVKYASPHILEFYNTVKRNSSYVHEVLVPKELMQKSADNFINIYSPYTSTTFKDIWGFLVIDATSKNPELGKIILKKLDELLSALNVKGRDGYGFNRTMLTYISSADGKSKLLRLSIGTESCEELDRKLKPILEFVNKANQILQLNAGEGVKKCEELISELASGYRALLEKKESDLPTAIKQKIENINSQDDLGRSQLFYAAKASNDDIVLTLLRRGADPHLADKIDVTPFITALINQRVENAASTRIVMHMLESKTQFPESYAKMPVIFGKLNAMIRNEIKDGTPEPLIDSIITAFNNQTNMSIKAQLQNVLLESLIAALNAQDFTLIGKLAKLTPTEFPLLVDFDHAQFTSYLKTSLKEPGHEQQKVACIECLLKSDSAIGTYLLQKDGALKAELEKEKEVNISKYLTDNFIELVENVELLQARKYIQSLSEKMKDELILRLEEPFHKHLAAILREDEVDLKKKNADGHSLLSLAYFTNSGKMQRFFSYLNKPALLESELIKQLMQTSMSLQELNLLAAFIHYVPRTFSELKLTNTSPLTTEIGSLLYTICAEGGLDFNKKHPANGSTLIEMVAVLPGEHAALFDALLAKIADPFVHRNSLSTSLKLLENLLSKDANPQIIIQLLGAIEPQIKEIDVNRQKIQKLFLDYISTRSDVTTQVKLLDVVSKSFLMKISSARMFSGESIGEDDFCQKITKMKEEAEALVFGQSSVSAPLSSSTLDVPPLLEPPPFIKRDL
ncbi:MAG: tetratricopeptide repeat protein [Gammaproteobacteria bacterium]